MLPSPPELQKERDFPFTPSRKKILLQVKRESTSTIYLAGFARRLFLDTATDDEAALPAFPYLARIADGGDASSPEVWEQPPYHEHSPRINLGLEVLK